MIKGVCCCFRRDIFLTMLQDINGFCMFVVCMGNQLLRGAVCVVNGLFVVIVTALHFIHTVLYPV